MTTYYLDGYNVLHRSETLKALTQRSLDAARDALINMLAEYCALTDDEIVLVFDGAGDPSKSADRVDELGRLRIVYCKNTISADTYIERAVFDSKNRLSVVVVTADRTVAQSARGMGALVLKPQSFVDQIESAQSESRIRRSGVKRRRFGTTLSDRLSPQVRAKLQTLCLDATSQKNRLHDKKRTRNGRAGPKTGS